MYASLMWYTKTGNDKKYYYIPKYNTMSRTILLFVFFSLNIISMVSGIASNSYADCVQVATKFSTTVSNGPVSNITSTTGTKVTCSPVDWFCMSRNNC